MIKKGATIIMWKCNITWEELLASPQCSSISQRDFQEKLNPEILALLERIAQFKYDKFRIGDISWKIPIYLDKKKEREEIITRKREDIENEIEILNERLKNIQLQEEQDISLSTEDEIDKKMLQGSISGLEDVLKSHPEQDEITTTVTTNLLGYYTRKGRNKRSEVVLLMETLGNTPYSKWRVATTLIHEMFHAYYDYDLKQQGEHIPLVEEPLTEYAMLKFVEEYVRQNPEDEELLTKAQWEVRNKIYTQSIRHYGFGYYLWNYEQRNPAICNWIEEYRKAKYAINSKTKIFKSYCSAFENGNYPFGNEYDTMVLLYELLYKAQGKKVTLPTSPVVTLPKGVTKWNHIGGSAYYCIHNDTQYLDGAFLGGKNLYELMHTIHSKIRCNIRKVVLWDHFICDDLDDLIKHFIHCDKIDVKVSPRNFYYVQDIRGLIYNREKTILFYCPRDITGTVILPQGLTEIKASAFDYCKQLKTLTIPYSVTEIPNSAFSECKSLTTEVILNNRLLCVPKDVKDYVIPKEVTEISIWAFDHCIELTNIVIHKDIKEIESRTFSYCKKLRNVSIPEGISKIGYCAFRDCLISSIELPGSLKEFHRWAFYDCPLNSLTFKGATPPTIDDPTDIIIPESCNIRVPKGAKTEYEKVFKNYQIEEF